MNPLLLLFGLDIGLLAFAYWAGSLVGLMVVMGLCFAVALGLIVFSTAPPGLEDEALSEGALPPGMGSQLSSFAALER